MMANIGFTDKQLHVYTRFQDMRRAYEDAHGRTYAPGFLTVLMDAFEKLDRIKVIPFSPDMELSDFVKTAVRLVVDDIADAEANEQVVIKDDSCRYMTESIMAGANFFLTDYKDKAMVFDNRDQATAFLRKCGHEVGNWIIEPA